MQSISLRSWRGECDHRQDAEKSVWKRDGFIDDEHVVQNAAPHSGPSHPSGNRSSGAPHTIEPSSMLLYSQERRDDYSRAVSPETIAGDEPGASRGRPVTTTGPFCATASRSGEYDFSLR